MVMYKIIPSLKIDLEKNVEFVQDLLQHLNGNQVITQDKSKQKSVKLVAKLRTFVKHVLRI